jgi:hypothetical protein
MKVYVVEKDAGSHYGVTMIDKIFSKLEDAENYKKEKDDIKKESLKKYFERGGYKNIVAGKEESDYKEDIETVNEVWITEYEVL